MKFNYETQGAITYLVCELEPTEQLDSLTLGMLTNNHIVGLAPFIYTEMNGQRYLKYNISAKISIGQFFGNNMDKQRTLMVFRNILDAICLADEYMIDKNCFSVLPEHIFLNVSNCETGLICVPTISDKNIDVEVANLFKNILASTQFNPNDDTTYITQLTAYLDNTDTCNVYGLRDLVANLQANNATAFGGPAFGTPNVQAQVQQQMAQPQTAQPQIQNAFNQPSVSVSSFDATITMDQMNEMMQKSTPKPVQQPTPQVAQVIPPTVPTPPAQPVVSPQAVTPTPQPIPQPVQTPRAQPIPQPMSPDAVNRPTNIPPVSTPQATPGMPNNFVKVSKPQPSAKSPANPGFAIPGQADNLNVPMPGAAGASKAPATPQGNVAQTDGDKKMSFFGLLANYNKENAELYKSQKKEKKAQKEKKEKEKKEKKAKPVKENATQPVTGAPTPTTPPVGNTSMGNPQMPGMPGQQAFTAPQVQPVIQPVPVQNSFNETTVLSALGGETTVLGEEPALSQPCLIRIKTGERIVINKPVFRIGKEKSYVDYFISDNTAISRSHANVHTESGEYFIEDTNSTNHTYLNGKIITSNVKTKLTSGDKIRLANEDFTFTV